MVLRLQLALHRLAHIKLNKRDTSRTCQRSRIPYPQGYFQSPININIYICVNTQVGAQRLVAAHHLKGTRPAWWVNSWPGVLGLRRTTSGEPKDALSISCHLLVFTTSHGISALSGSYQTLLPAAVLARRPHSSYFPNIANRQAPHVPRTRFFGFFHFFANS